MTTNAIKEEKNNKVMLSVQDVMEILDIGRDHAYNLMRSNKFPTVKIGRMRKVHKEVFEKWLKGELQN